MALARRRMTADEFLALPPTDQYRRAQLIDGELVVSSPTARHQRLVFRLVHEIASWIDDDPARGEVINVDVPCSPTDVFQPDLAWVRPERRPAADVNHFDVDEPPDLVVEVRSPSTWRYDVGRKRQLYEAVGVAELWLVDGVDERVVVFRRTPDAPAFDDERVLGRGDTLSTPLLPGLVLDLAALFDAGQ